MKRELVTHNTLLDVVGVRLNFEPFTIRVDGVELADLELGWDSHQMITIEHDRWNPDICALSLRFGVQLKGIDRLFGPDGICSEESSIALICEWVSTGSSIRGVTEPIPLDYGSDVFHHQIELDFESGMLRNRLELQLHIVLIAVKNPVIGLHCLIPGTILGSLGGCCTFTLDGHNPGFRYVESEKSAKEPLWEMIWEVEDPSADLIMDAFGLSVNRSHPRYPDLVMHDRSNGFFDEVLQSLLLDFMSKVIEDHPDLIIDVIKGETFDRGTVADYVSYLIKTRSVDTSGHEGLRKTIRLLEFQ